jgi:hypothetical protein
LGDEKTFERLAQLARVHRCWRKVAKLVYWLHVDEWGGNRGKFGHRPNGTFQMALGDTKVPEVIKQELRTIYNIHRPDQGKFLL